MPLRRERLEVVCMAGLLFIYLFLINKEVLEIIYLNSRVTERERSSTYWFVPQMLTMPKAGLG